MYLWIDHDMMINYNACIICTIINIVHVIFSRVGLYLSQYINISVMAI